MRKLLSVFGLLVGVSLVMAQAPPGPTDGIVFTTDDNGVSYPYLYSTGLPKPPPYAVKGQGAVNKVKYPNGKITSEKLKVIIASQKTEDGIPTWTVETTATVRNGGLEFEITSPPGGVNDTIATVKVYGKFKPTATDPERDVDLSGIASVKQ